MRYQPVRMVCGVITAAAVIGLLVLIDDAAANALFSLAVAGNDLAWLTPILARLLWGNDRFVPGEFYTGKYFSKPIAWVAVVYMVFAIVLSMIPTEGPDPSREFLPERNNMLISCANCPYSPGYELYRCYQRVALGWCTALLCALREENL